MGRPLQRSGPRRFARPLIKAPFIAEPNPLATADAVERLRRERRTQEHIAGELGIKHIRTKPYTPQTNGKAERFIQTALREWAYATAFEHSDQRRQALLPFLHRYNWHRPHASLAKKPPISRLGLTSNNLLRLHS